MHPDKMTNGNIPCSLINFYVSVHFVDNISLVNIYTRWIMQHNGINYNNNDSNDNNDNNVQKENGKYVHSEPYGSAKLAINVQTFTLRESGD